MRISTLNVNGLRAASRRGLGEWLARRQPDVIALQEVRCPVGELPLEVLGDYLLTYESGTIPGRNGVAVLTRTPVAAVRSWGDAVVGATSTTEPQPLAVEQVPLARELGYFRGHGRYLEVDLADAPVTVASVYVPKGGRPSDDTEPAYEAKLAFMAGFAKQVTRARRAAAARGRHYLLMGDVNIAHTADDLANAAGNVRNPGFLPVEREWLTSLVGPRRLVDVVRSLHPGVKGPYSWWSWRGQAWTNDSGWRIDYHLATPGLAALARVGGTDRDESYEARISDHAPVSVDYDL
ncbi:exodeoxyribonuclease III [Propionibacteriaceae bacterium G1746]|uniref:exodeoxyribonuclease III n=1 Tax=Aestuariimicrobium sp. G57 TaxID=3418485 RepID=UPI003C1AD65A